jgi:hypothetical protein
MAPPCRTITVFAFRGDRSRAFAGALLQALDEQKKGSGPGPVPLDCLLYAGHTGVSTDGGTTIYGFNPDGSQLPLWELMDRLKKGEPFPGVVRDDTSVFAEARKRGLTVRSFEVIFPDPGVQDFQTRLDSERKKSRFSYGFPNGDGDCNCNTWLERLGVPLLTGRMDELIGLPAIRSCPSRKFGECT